MHQEKNGISFSQVMEAVSENIDPLAGIAGLYMICKKDNKQKNQVIFAGVAADLKESLTLQLANYTSPAQLTFCYTQTSTQTAINNSQKPLYERVA